MDKEFNFLVTPIGFNISLEVASNAFNWEKGYGSPEVHNVKPGEAVRISTEFPSLENEKGEKRGGMMLFLLSKNNDSKDEKLIVRYNKVQCNSSRKTERIIIDWNMKISKD
jgi:Ca-activated chloride channel family protein